MAKAKTKTGTGQLRSPATGTGAIGGSVHKPMKGTTALLSMDWKRPMTEISGMGMLKELSPKRTAIITDKLKAH
jgi:hypothetical protein